MKPSQEKPNRLLWVFNSLRASSGRKNQILFRSYSLASRRSRKGCCKWRWRCCCCGGVLETVIIIINVALQHLVSFFSHQERERERDINDFQKMKQLLFLLLRILTGLSGNVKDTQVKCIEDASSYTHTHTDTERQRQVTSGFQHFLAVCP